MATWGATDTNYRGGSISKRLAVRCNALGNVCQFKGFLVGRVEGANGISTACHFVPAKLRNHGIAILKRRGAQGLGVGRVQCWGFRWGLGVYCWGSEHLRQPVEADKGLHGRIVRDPNSDNTTWAQPAAGQASGA